MKTSSLNSINILALALCLGTASSAWAQQPPQGVDPNTQGIVPNTIAPMPGQAVSAATPTPPSSLNAEIPGASTVLNKLKQNTTPVTVSDMVAAQDVLTRLDLIGQIEDKMAKLDEAKNKRMEDNLLASVKANPNSNFSGSADAGTNANAAAINALQNAMKGSGGRSYSPGMAQVLTVSGVGGDYSALLQLDGHQLNVKKGSVVPGIGTVSNINDKEILITKPNGKTTTLGFTQN